MLELACNLVDQLTIGADAVRVGAVVFGTNANVAIPIGAYVSFYLFRNQGNDQTFSSVLYDIASTLGQ